MSEAPFELKELLKDRKRALRRIETAKKALQSARFVLDGVDLVIGKYYPDAPLPSIEGRPAMKTLFKLLPGYVGIKMVTADDPGTYPGKDHDGESIYINTHYETAAEALESCQENAQCRITMAWRQIEESQKHLQKCREEAGDACEAYARFEEFKYQWEMATPSPTSLGGIEE